MSDPTVSDEAFDLLHRAGWSLGIYAAGCVWIVEGVNGENLLWTIDQRILA